LRAVAPSGSRRPPQSGADPLQLPRTNCWAACAAARILSPAPT